VLASLGVAVEFRILGPLEVVDRGRTLALGGPRQRALLALLLTRANRVVSRDELIDELWDEDAPDGARNALQYHVSRLRKALAPSDALVTREPGYMIRVSDEELDLLRFERLRASAGTAPADEAARTLRRALDLWRGPPLGDLAHEPFAQTEIARLEELHVTALEERIDADLESGRDAELVAELEPLVHEHPLRERLRAQLMLALYRSGRQAEALDVYRQTREALIGQLGLEPSPSLQELERAILRHDPALLPDDDVAPAPEDSAVMIVADAVSPLEALLAIAEPLRRELIIVRLLDEAANLRAASAELADRRDALRERGVSARVAAYVAGNPGDEAARFAAEHHADLLLVDATSDLLADGRPSRRLDVLLERVPCDVGLLVSKTGPASGPVVTPFGGVEHDWSAIEIAARLAGALGTSLLLLGTEADPALGRRDASRLLARASLVVQQVVGIVTEPMLVPAGREGVLDGARDARLLVIGLSERWRTEGIGSMRLSVAEGANAPTLFVRGSGRTPSQTMTRFTWTLGSQDRAPRAGQETGVE
jgi:DNA-binding SARP family transcriptional activator